MFSLAKVLISDAVPDNPWVHPGSGINTRTLHSIDSKCFMSQGSEARCPDHFLWKKRWQNDLCWLSMKNISVTRWSMTTDCCEVSLQNVNSYATLLRIRCNGCFTSLSCWSCTDQPVSSLCTCATPLSSAFLFFLQQIENVKRRQEPAQSTEQVFKERSPLSTSQIRGVRCLRVQMSYPLVSETIALTFDLFILERSSSSKFKGFQCKPGALVEITKILLFVSLCARTNARPDSHTLPRMMTSVSWYAWALWQ